MIIHLILALAVAAASTAAGPAEPPAKPFPAPAPEGKTLFERLDPKATGVAFTNPLVPDHPLARLYASSMCVGGVAVGDVDNDGLLDLYFTSGPAKNKLYHAKAPFVWEEVEAGVDGGEAWGAGCALVDVDGDGDLDIYVCNYESPNQLFINTLIPSGKLGFEEKAKEWGVDHIDAGHTPAFCDYDRDGDMDLYLMANLLYLEEGRPLDAASVVVMENGFPAIAEKWNRYLKITDIKQNAAGGLSADWDKRGRPHVLYRNDGGKFTNVTEAAGINPEGGMGLSATWWDFNQDGWPDLYVACDFEDPDRFYRNNGDGTFTDIVKTAVPNTPWFAMGADFGDVNGDGRPDFIVGDMFGSTHFKQKTSMGNMAGKTAFLTKANPRQYMRNALYINTGTERFMECAQQTHLDRTDWTWAMRIADLDNDGRNDVFVTNGMTRNYNDSDNPSALKLRPGENEWQRHVRSGTPRLKEQNFAFRNEGGMRFDDVSKLWGLDFVGMSFGAATADFDHDGNLDLVVVNFDEPVHIYRNAGNANHRVELQLVSKKGDRRGIGAQVRADTEAGVQTAEVTLTRGYMACNEPLVHLGLGSATVIRKLTVAWPSGRIQSFEGLAADKLYTITEPDGEAPKAPSPAGSQPLFGKVDLGVKPVHKEIPFDDFAREILLPNKLSQLGPGIAVGDVNGDGRDDFFLGGAKGQAGQLFVQDASGRFSAMPEPALEEDARCEDMGAVFFDADGDGDADLYVVSGGYEYEPGDRALDDRLYLNDGKGKFTRAADALPFETDSGSCVCAADFDRDGDIDLFVGGRVHIAAYPTGPGGRLLINDGRGHFADAKNPALAKLGMVTGAVWSDADNDGWLDLLVVGEWNSPRFFKNTNGKLADTTDAATAKLTGWWTGISAADLDADGDMDYVVTNFGQNTKYHARADKPVKLFYADFDDKGRKKIVEAEYENNTLFPVRGRSCSSQEMPFIKEKFGTFKDFALAPLAEIYTPEKLKSADVFECRELNTGILRNKGRGEFTFEPLPWMAQASPCFGSAITARDAIVLAQNFYTPQPETGHMGNGVGVMLARDRNSWTGLWPRESGVLVPEDAKSLATIDLGGRPALLFGINNGEMKSYVATDELLAVKLRGPAIGARVECGGQASEVAAGSGYLTQNSATLFFKKPAEATTIKVRWPDGKKTARKCAAGAKSIEIAP